MRNEKYQVHGSIILFMKVRGNFEKEKNAHK